MGNVEDENKSKKIETSRKSNSLKLNISKW